MNEFADWVRARGFDPETITTESRTFLEGAYRAEQDKPAKVPDREPEPNRLKAAGEETFDAKMAAIEAENARIQAIRDLTVSACEQWVGNPGKVQQLKAACEAAVNDQKTDVRDFRLALTRLSRPDAPNVYASSAPEVTGDVLEAAFAKRIGIPNREKQYDARTLEAADRSFKRGIGLQELLGHFARRGGWRGLSLSAAVESKSFYQAAFSDDANGHDVRAGMAGPSTYSLPNILANVANKGLKASFESVDQAWRQIADIKPVSDFKQISTVSLVGDLMYKEVPRGGELRHGSVQERAYTNQASTYGILLGIDRRDIINDDAGAIATATRHVGRGAGLKLNSLFYTIFNLNTSFFSAGNANVITGGTSVLSGATGLEALRLGLLKFMQQTDPAGFPLGIRPAILFVPPELEVSAKNLINSTEVLGTTTANSLVPTANAFANTLRVVSTPYLSNTSFSGSSTTAWYLLAEPSEMAVMQAVFVNGVDTPTVETADMDWNTLGMAWRGYIDAGFAFQEYRGGLRAAGA